MFPIDWGHCSHNEIIFRILISVFQCTMIVFEMSKMQHCISSRKIGFYFRQVFYMPFLLLFYGMWKKGVHCYCYRCMPRWPNKFICLGSVKRNASCSQTRRTRIWTFLLSDFQQKHTCPFRAIHACTAVHTTTFTLFKWEKYAVFRQSGGGWCYSGNLCNQMFHRFIGLLK